MRARFPVTVHLLFLRGSQVLLLRRANTGYADGMYSLPAGHLESGESLRAAAAREAEEEIGLQLELSQIVFAGVMHRKEQEERVDFFVRVKEWQGEPVNAEPGKCDELRWFEIGALPEDTIPYVKRAVQNYLALIPFDEFGWEG